MEVDEPEPKKDETKVNDAKPAETVSKKVETEKKPDATPEKEKKVT
jgi:hypothetical protein